MQLADTRLADPARTELSGKLLNTPAARCIARGEERLLLLGEVEALLAEADLLLDFADRVTEREGLFVGRPQQVEGEPLGGPLEVPSDATVHGTYDSEGRPWVVFHRLLEPAGPIEDALSAPPAAIRAHAFRLAGESWADRGELRVQSVGSPGATPAPQAADGILSGTGLFTAGRPPSSWVASVPKLSREHTAQILPLASQSGAAVLYTAAGDLMLTTDRGRTWQRSDWRPLNPASADLELDLPQGDRRGAFYALWIERRPFDREVPEILHLTELTAGPRWQVVEKLPSSVILDTGRQLNFNHVLVPRAGAWMLVASCATSEAGPGVVVRMRELGKLGPTKFLLIR